MEPSKNTRRSYQTSLEEHKTSYVAILRKAIFSSTLAENAKTMQIREGVRRFHTFQATRHPTARPMPTRTESTIHSGKTLLWQDPLLEGLRRIIDPGNSAAHA